MNIGIFCSANNSLDPEFFRLTADLGRWIGESGHTLVFGGCNMGLMECVAKSAREAGGRTIGVVPTMLEKHGRVSANVDVEIRCDNLSDRKDLLLAHSDVLVALPGGIGTLDEIFTVAAAATIGYHAKRVVIYNMNGFWDSLASMLDRMGEMGVLRGDWRRLIAVAGDFDELRSLVEEDGGR